MICGQRTSVRLCWAAFALSLLLSGCSASGGASIPARTYPATTNSEPQALFEGRLELDSGCPEIYGVYADGYRIGIAFPAGTTFLSDQEVVVLPGGQELPLRHEIALGGGYYLAELLTGTTSPDSATPAESAAACGFGEYFLANLTQ